MNTITITLEEAQSILAILRVVQMGGDVDAGALLQAVNELEGSIDESGTVDFNTGHVAEQWSCAERVAIGEFDGWATELTDGHGNEDPDKQQRFRDELKALLAVVRLAARELNRLPGSSEN